MMFKAGDIIQHIYTKHRYFYVEEVRNREGLVMLTPLDYRGKALQCYTMDFIEDFTLVTDVFRE